MAKKITYKRKSISEDDHHGMKPCCGNCDLMDYFVTAKDRQAFSEGGSKAVFKDNHGNIIGTEDDCRKTFCTLTGVSVQPEGYCTNHLWAKEVWVKEDEEIILC